MHGVPIDLVLMPIGAHVDAPWGANVCIVGRWPPCVKGVRRFGALVRSFGGSDSRKIPRFDDMVDQERP